MYEFSLYTAEIGIHDGGYFVLYTTTFLDTSSVGLYWIIFNSKQAVLVFMDIVVDICDYRQLLCALCAGERQSNTK